MLLIVVSCRFFNEDTKPKISAEYKNDQLNGKTLIYTNGKLKTTKKNYNGTQY